MDGISSMYVHNLMPTLSVKLGQLNVGRGDFSTALVLSSYIFIGCPSVLRES